MAVERVEKLLRSTCHALDGEGVLYAVVGGNAVAEWVGSVDEDAIRSTKDVDILLRRGDLPQAAAALDGIGLMQEEVLGVTVFISREDPSPKRGVHVVLAGERVREHYRHANPDVTESVRAASGFRVVKLLELVKMKLQAWRDVDRTHIRDMMSVGLIDDALAVQLPPDLLDRLEQIRQTPE
ncbi:MAG: hypothetical protein HOP29_07310 [Phycisphaerales bacterium]|nr:hypothetical protein [Phycisphaerales bacterium]